MKKLLIPILILLLLPIKLNAQRGDGAVLGAVAGLVGGAIGVAATIELIKESMEQSAVEYFIDAYPEAKVFELSTSSLNGTKFSDLSSVSVVTFEVTNISDGNRYALFAFTSFGWANEYGVDFNKLRWMLFNQEDWNLLIKKFLETSKNKEIDINSVGLGKLDDKGLKIEKDYVFEYPRINGDIYSIGDYDNELKVVYNEKSMNLYLRESKDLVKLRNNTINRIHTFLNRHRE